MTPNPHPDPLIQAAERWSTNDHDALMEELLDCVCSGDEMSDPRVTFDLVRFPKCRAIEIALSSPWTVFILLSAAGLLSPFARALQGSVLRPANSC